MWGELTLNYSESSNIYMKTDECSIYLGPFWLLSTIFCSFQHRSPVFLLDLLWQPNIFFRVIVYAIVFFNFCFYMLVYISIEIQLLFVFLFFILHAYWTHSLVLKIFSRFLRIFLLRLSICIILLFLMFQDSLFSGFHYAQITFLSYSLGFAGEKFC